MYRSTLLFKSQYHKYKGIFDYKTKNIYFLKMVSILKKMGINNRYFFLYLSQPSLQGIDPHDENLTKEQKIKIAYECRINPWYYFREVVRIKSSGGINRFILHRANLALLWLFFNDVIVFLTIPRQKGKTFSVQVLQSYIQYIRGIKITSALFTKDNPLRVETIEWLRSIRDSLPSYLINKVVKDADNTRTIEYSPLGNKYISFVSQNNPVAAEKIGRGSPIPIVHFDEIVLFNLINITFPSCMNSMDRALKLAKENQMPRGVIITTTAGNLDILPGMFSYKMKSESYQFSDNLYDIRDHDELIKVIKKSSLAKRVYVEFSSLQLGSSKEELKEAIARSTSNGVDKLQVLRDLFNIWTRGTDKTPFDADIIEQLKNTNQEIKYNQIINDYTFRWYRSKEEITGNWFKNTPIIIGIDPSENIGKDYTAFVFLNALDGSVIGVMRCNESNVIKIALLIIDFIIKYPNIIVNIERNSTGIVIIDKIIIDLINKNINPLKRLFNFIVQDSPQDLQTTSLYDIENSSKVRKQIGFRTTRSKSRGRDFLFVTVLMKFLDNFISVINDSIIIDEICSLKERNGRIDHDINGHDDTLVAYLMAGYVLFYGKHLKKYKFLNVTKREILELSYVNFRKGTDEEDQRYKRIVNEISDLQKKINNPKTILLIKNKLKLKKNKLLNMLPEKYKNTIITKDKALRIENNKDLSTTQNITKPTFNNPEDQLDFFIGEMEW